MQERRISRLNDGAAIAAVPLLAEEASPAAEGEAAASVVEGAAAAATEVGSAGALPTEGQQQEGCGESEISCQILPIFFLFYEVPVQLDRELLF